jgi:integrase
MRRQLERLSPAQVKHLKDPGLHPDGGNLYLQVSPVLTKSWVFRFQLNGHERAMGLGSANDVGLRQARDLARECRLQVKNGIDPIEDRRAKRAETAAANKPVVTFAEAAAQLLASKEAAWGAIHVRQWTNTIRDYINPVIGSMPVAAIDTAHVLKVIEPHWKEKTETADRLRARIEAVLNWAKARKLREGENPARWRGHLDHILPSKAKLKKKQHFTAMPHAEIAGFMQELRKLDGMAARALEWTVLTVARTGETLGATWQEVADGFVWRISAERMKAARGHEVPLPGRCREILREIHAPGIDLDTISFEDLVKSGAGVDPDGLIFGNLSDKALRRVMERLGSGTTVHGFRSAFRDWCIECTSFPREVVEMALAHVVGTETERAYMRTNLLAKRSQLMDAWATYVSTPAPVSAEVIPIGIARKNGA